MHPSFVKYFVFPSVKFIQGKNVLAHLKELKKMQWLTAEEMKLLQLQRLRTVLSFAHKNVPFYRKRLNESGISPDDIQKIDDLMNIPILTKEDVRNNLDKLLASNCKRRTLIKSPTSGSTGEPAMFYMGKQAAASKEAARLLGLSWWNINIGDREAMLWASPIEMSRLTGLHAFVKKQMNQIMLPAFDLTESKMVEFTKIIKKFRPDFLYAIASSLHIYANYLNENNINARDWKLKAVVSSTETLLAHERELAQEVFGCKVIDEYGSRECGVIAYHCPQGGLHTFAPNVLVEYIRQGDYVSEGKTGEIIITRLDSYSMPLIRYKIGDIGAPSNKICKCGRGMPLMDKFEGRLNDMIVTPEGKYMTSIFFTHFFKDFRSISEFQIIQKELSSLLIRIKDKKGIRPDVRSDLEKKIKYYVSRNINIEFETVDSIPRPNSNKRRIVISKIPVKFSKRFTDHSSQLPGGE